MHWDESEIFKILPFYNSYIERSEVKKLNSVELMKELPFYNELSIAKNKTVFSGYPISYKIETVDKKGVVIQLKSSGIALQELFIDLLIELKGFKYQIALSVLLSKVKSRELLEYSTIYLNLLTKTVIADKFYLDQCFNDVAFRLENWISHGSRWIVEEIVSQYLNVRSCLPLSGSTYLKLPKELNHPMKGLINVKKFDSK